MLFIFAHPLIQRIGENIFGFLLKNTNFFSLYFRKQGLGAGETIQSYNHQQRLERSLKHQQQHDDENIDVVNDDKEKGKYLYIFGFHNFLSNEMC